MALVTTDPLYCTIPALAGYSSYLVGIPRTRMKASFHICGTTLHAWQHDLSHLLPTTSFASVRTELSQTNRGCIIGSVPDRRLATTCVIDLGAVLGFLLLRRQGSRSLWKGRQ